MKKLILGIILAFTIVSPVYAENCNLYTHINTNLSEMYGEAVKHIGLSSQGTMLLVYVNKDNGTYTLVMVQPNKVACIIDDGEGWGDVMPLPPEEEVVN